MTPMTAAKSSNAANIWRIFSVVVEAVLNTRPEPPCALERREAEAGRDSASRPAPMELGADYLGHAFSMLSTVVLVSWPVIQLVACFQNASEPTAAGIWSEPSKRNCAFGSSRIVAASLSIGLVRLFGSRPLLALTQPDDSFALVLAHSGLDR